MIRALLDGRKTQTRRAVKPQPWPSARSAHYSASHPSGSGGRHRASVIFSERETLDPPWAYLKPIPCPFGEPGDRLWVRESGVISKLRAVYDKPGLFRHDVPTTPQTGHYWVEQTRAPGASYNAIACKRESALLSYGAKACPSIHMPRWASRILLEITDVRVERLQDISEADALAEGVSAGDWEYGNGEGSESAVESFQRLWDSLKPPAEQTWDANPFVWVVEFRRVTAE